MMSYTLRNHDNVKLSIGAIQNTSGRPMLLSQADTKAPQSGISSLVWML